MIADKRNPARQFDDPEIRFFLFYGPDEAGSRGLAKQLMNGRGAEWVQFEGSNLKTDPARLSDEAGAISMFGGPRLIWIEPAGDEITDAVAALLEAPVIECPVVAIAGGLRRNGRLLKLTEKHVATLVHASYAPEGRALEDLVDRMAREAGLLPDPGVVSRIATAVGGNRAIAAQEVGKFALYLDASPETPQALSHDVIDKLGAEWTEERFFAIGDAAMAGDLPELEQVLAGMSAGGSEGITVIRALQRRILQLAPLQARIAAGETVSGVMASQVKALFWKDKSLIQTLLHRWPAARLARLAERVGALEKRLIFGKGPARAELAEEMLAVARAGKR